MAKAQDYYVFSQINSNHGLSDNRVRTICQLNDGRMVIITEGLVNIYDGSSFHYLHYNEQKAYKLDDYTGYHRAYVDNNNLLWLKNQFKLMLFDIRTEKFVPHIDSLFSLYGISKKVTNLFMDCHYNFWFLTKNDEVYLKRKTSEKAQLFLSKLSGASRYINDRLYDLAVIDKQLFLFYKSGEIVCYDIDTAKEEYRENPFGDNENHYSNTLMVVPNKQYLYQSRDGFSIGQLLRFNTLNRKWERVLETDYWLNTLSIDKHGICWISSFSGLWVIDENLQNKRLISPLLMVDGQVFESEICTQFNDNQGGLWVGTLNRGILYYHPNRFKFRNYGKSLFDTSGQESVSINTLIVTNNRILVGTQKGLFAYNEKYNKLEKLSLIPSNSHCEMLYTDSQNRTWVCTRNNGLFCIDSEKTTNFSNLRHCNYIYESFDGQIYLGTNEGLVKFDPNNKSFIKASGEKVSNVYQITHYKQDTLCGHSDNGLFFYHIGSNTVSLPTKDHKILEHINQNYHCIYTDSRGLIWLGTRDGLNIYNPAKQSTISFHESDGLINNSIRSIIEDQNGKVWVSTSSGISCVETNYSNGNYKYRFTNYNRFDGVIENEFLPRSVCKTKDGRLLWGGLDGFNEIDLKQIEKPEPQLYVPLFTRFSLAGTEIKMGESYDNKIILKQSITTTKEIKLEHDQNFFSVEFSALNYINPTQTAYRYQLVGIDAEWREIKPNDGIGRASYTSLSPGTYKLKVQATNNNQLWDERFAELTLVIEPPFWRTIWAYSAYLIVIIALVYSSFSYSIQQKIQKAQKIQNEELDQMKFKFFTNISHELRTPLTLIITPLESVIKKLNDDTLKSQLIGVSRNANELLNLVNQLLAFRKLEMKGETLNLNYCNIGELSEAIIAPFIDLAHINDINLEYHSPSKELFVYVDQDKLRKIVNNLLSNALKFTPKKGIIKFKLQKNDNDRTIIIQVSDTGCGIGKNEQAQIFDRFYQAKNQKNNTGSGIGLHLVKEYVELHNGSISVESNVGQGSIFTVALPCDLKHQSRIDESYNQAGNKKSLKILMVEDNVEFSNFLSNELSEKYQVIVASNGQEGLQKAQEEQPDLIVSDVMMPVMTGIELCQKIKSDISISHTPVILLTAKTSDEAQIEGFEAGADAYISKPFNMDILLLRIENLIEQQEHRKQAFKKNIEIEPSSLTSNNIDQDIIARTIGHIIKNMSNSSYSVEQLSKDMFMDRSGLYRKLMAISGQTPTEFIRSVRLKKAAQLLVNGLQVSDVAQQVGYGSTSYFTKCFQDEFGVKPSHYKNKR